MGQAHREASSGQPSIIVANTSMMKSTCRVCTARIREEVSDLKEIFRSHGV